MSEPDRQPAFVFEGFDSPNTTQVPDAFFDVVAPELSEAELRVALYIIRRTFGFKKDSDNISLRQMVNGITTRDGRVLDRGTGLKKSAVANALNGLERKGVILSQRNRSRERGNEPTTYALNIKHHPLSVPVDNPLSTGTDNPLSVPVDTQKTEEQDPVGQHTGEGSTCFDGFASTQQTREPSGLSKGASSGESSRQTRRLPSSVLLTVSQTTSRRGGITPEDALNNSHTAHGTAVEAADGAVDQPTSSQARQAAQRRSQPDPRRNSRRPLPPKLPPHLEAQVTRYSEELHDPEHLPQNLGQAGRLWESSGWPEANFGQALADARAITLRRDIKKRATAGGDMGARNKMPYYFKVLRDLLGIKES